MFSVFDCFSGVAYVLILLPSFVSASHVSFSSGNDNVLKQCATVNLIWTEQVSFCSSRVCCSPTWPVRYGATNLDLAFADIRLSLSSLALPSRKPPLVSIRLIILLLIESLLLTPNHSFSLSRSTYGLCPIMTISDFLMLHFVIWVLSMITIFHGQWTFPSDTVLA